MLFRPSESSKKIVDFYRRYEPNTMKASGEKIYICRKGLFTNYPWPIGDIGDVLDVPTTHTLGQTYSSDVWLKFSNTTDER